ncbi:hypothetical protein [Natronosalvus rutilus]|uniref:DUF8074 domain-containing protein n=1 Tax=Natronosalvus rutilus TaxID=2953753 RepID=A0A9E7N8S4_9EURY|nr:hypothetical protein [Natronosalvus rutilus]UTF52443.1 hypothetical protein NGM29_11650 [Natronosalvus rutilus]
MRVTVADSAVFMYNLGVVLSGGYVATMLNVNDRYQLLGVMVVFALFWTIYFKFYMRSRLETLDERSESG